MGAFKNTSAKLFLGRGLSMFVKAVHPPFPLTRAKLFSALKWALFTVNAIYLYIVLSENASLAQLAEQLSFKKLSASGIALLSVTFALVAVNWGIEAAKWRNLISKFQYIKFRQAFAAILAGSAVSLWIPNRAGDYLGRIFWLQPKSQLQGILATLVGSLAQICVTLILGVVGLIFYAWNRVEFAWFTEVAPALGVLLVALLLFFYFNINKIKYLLPKYRWAVRVRKYLMVYSYYNFTDLARVLWLSFLRYFVFSTQFLLVLYLFQIDVTPLQGFMSIFLIYLVQTVVPSTALSELGIRGAASVFFLQDYDANAVSILSASYALWLINLLLPGIIGLVVLAFVKAQKQAQA